MIRVDVKNEQNVVGWSSEFLTQEEADAWVAQETAAGSWGAVFTVEQTDVSAEKAEEASLRNRLLKQDFGALMIAKITEINSSKNLDQAGLAALLSDMNALAIERLLWSGSLSFAKAAIASYPGSLYTSEEKTALVAEIDAFLASIQE